MPLVKLIKYYGVGCYECSYQPTPEEASTWQEISDEELNFLSSNEGRSALIRDNVNYVVLQDVTQKLPDYIHDIKEFIEKEKKKVAERKLKEQAKIEAKRKTMLEKKLEKARKLLKENDEL